MRLLAVHAHPDDETLSTGALLATWAAAGHPVTLVTCTRGERGEVIGEALAHLEGDGPALAAHREVELAAALRALGVTDHHFLDTLAPLPPAQRDLDAPRDPGAPSSGRGTGAGAPVRYEDSGMAWLDGVSGTAGLAADLPADALVAADVDAAAGRLAGLLRRERPDVVVTYDAGGGYGHPDHVRAHELVVRALELAREADAAGLRPGATTASDAGAHLHADCAPAAQDRWRPLVLCPTVRTADLAARHAHLAAAPWTAALAQRDALAVPSPDDAPPSVASDDRSVAVEVDARPVVDRVLGALTAHATQVRSVTRAPSDDAVLVAAYALSNDVLAGVPVVETYAVLAGPVDVLGAAGAAPRGVTRVA